MVPIDPVRAAVPMPKPMSLGVPVLGPLPRCLPSSRPCPLRRTNPSENDVRARWARLCAAVIHGPRARFRSNAPTACWSSIVDVALILTHEMTGGSNNVVLDMSVRREARRGVSLRAGLYYGPPARARTGLEHKAVTQGRRLRQHVARRMDADARCAHMYHVWRMQLLDLWTGFARGCVDACTSEDSDVVRRMHVCVRPCPWDAYPSARCLVSPTRGYGPPSCPIRLWGP